MIAIVATNSAGSLAFIYIKVGFTEDVPSTSPFFFSVLPNFQQHDAAHSPGLCNRT